MSRPTPLPSASGMECELGGSMSKTPPLSNPLPESPSPLLNPQEEVRALLRRHPQTREVFARHGLMGCGGAAGPAEPLDQFALVHRVELLPLLRELEAAIAAEPPPEGSNAGEAGKISLLSESSTPPIPWRLALAGAVLSTLLMGTLLGAIHLEAIWGGHGIPSALNGQLHAHAQRWGFLALFIVGVAGYTLPRFFRDALAFPEALRLAVFALLGGTILRATTPLFHHGAAVGATLLTLLGMGAFSLAAAGTFWRAGCPREGFEKFLMAGLAWGIIAAVLDGFAAFTGAGGMLRGDGLQASYQAFLLGFATSFALGYSLRTFPVFLGLPEPRASRMDWTFFLLQGGVLLSTLACLLPSIPRAPGQILSALALLAGIGTVRPFPRVLKGPPAEGDRGFPPFVAAAYGWLGITALLLLALPLVHGGQGALADASRHALSLGFLSNLIMGMSSRIVPVFQGVPLAWPRARTAAWLFLQLSVALRMLQIPASLTDPEPFRPFIAASGAFALLAFIAFAAFLFATLVAQPEDLELPSTPAEPDENSLIVHILASSPEALSILVEAGFTPLAHPALRRTLARGVTLSTACRMKKVAIGPLLEQLRRAWAIAQVPTRAPGDSAPSNPASSTPSSPS